MEKKKTIVCPYCDGKMREVRVKELYAPSYYWIYQCYDCLKYKEK